MFLLPVRSQNRQKIVLKRSKIDFEKHLVILAVSFPAPDPKKRENTSRVKDFRGAGYVLHGEQRRILQLTLIVHSAGLVDRPFHHIS